MVIILKKSKEGACHNQSFNT